MRTAKTKLLISCLIAVLAFQPGAFCQKPYFSLGSDLALPANGQETFNNRGTGWGGSARVELPWSKHFLATVTASYVSFGTTRPYPTAPERTEQVDDCLLQAGLKYHINKMNPHPYGFFFTGETGWIFTKNHIIYENKTEQHFKESGLSLALGTGYQFKPIEASFRLQWNLSGEGYHIYYYNFRLAYTFLRKR